MQRHCARGSRKPPCRTGQISLISSVFRSVNRNRSTPTSCSGCEGSLRRHFPSQGILERRSARLRRGTCSSNQSVWRPRRTTSPIESPPQSAASGRGAARVGHDLHWIRIAACIWQCARGCIDCGGLLRESVEDTGPRLAVEISGPLVEEVPALVLPPDAVDDGVVFEFKPLPDVAGLPPGLE